MTLRQWLFDYPASGTSLTTANVRSEDNVAPQQVNASGGTIQSSTAQIQAGTSSVRFEHSTTPGAIRLPLVSATSQQLAVSFYLHHPSYPASEGFCSIRHASGVVGHVQASATGALGIIVPSGTTVTGVPGDVPVNTWVRVEVLTDTAAATMTATTYLGDSLTPVATLTHSALLSTAALAALDIGRPSGTTGGYTQYFDSVQTNDGTTTPIGPYFPPVPPETNAYVRVNGAWVLADPYVRTGGAWVLADAMPI